MALAGLIGHPWGRVALSQVPPPSHWNSQSPVRAGENFLLK